MQKYVEFVQKNRDRLFAVLIILNVLALVGIFQIRIDPAYEVFMPKDSRYKKILDKMNSVFRGSEQMIFLIESQDSQLTVETVEEFRGFQKFLQKMEEVRHVTGPAPDKVASGGDFIELDSLTAVDLPALRDYYNRLGELSPLKDKGGRLYAVFEVFPGEHFTYKDIRKIEDYLEERDLVYYATGDVYMQQKIVDYILLILLFVPPLALLLILSVFRMQMGSLKATFLSVLPAGIGALWTLGLIGWIGKEVSLITVLAPVFTIVIGSADGLHFVSHVQDERGEGKGTIESTVETLKMVGIPMIITTVTSMAGFLSLLVMNNNAIKDLSIFASTGIFLAGVVTWYVLPLILTGRVVLRRPQKHKGQAITGAIRRLWGKPSIVVLVVLLVLAGFGARRVSTEFNQLMIYRDYTQVHKSFEKIMEVNDGSVPVFLYLETDGSPLDPSYAERIMEFEEELVASEQVGKAVSVYDLYAMINSFMSGSGEPAYPSDLFRLTMVNSVIAGMPDNPASNLIDVKEKAARVVVFPADLKNQTLDAISSRVADFNEENEDMEIRETGVQYLMRELNQSMIENQTKSLLLAFGLIVALLFVSLRRLKPALISVLPILFTVVILYGFLGLLGISLNVITTTIFGITIGVGIDYAIHFTSVWMSFRKRGCDSAEAASRAYDYTSRPILANAMGLAVGLSALLFSPLRVHLYVSGLMWVSMVAGVFLSLSFLPAVLRL